MRGTILGVHEGRGVLLDANERRLEFPLSEWRSPGLPTAGQAVDFVDSAGAAQSVYAVPPAAAAPIARSGSFVLGCVSVGCLLLGFIIPLLPTVAAFIVGMIGAGQAIAEKDDAALILSRIGWIGALVLLIAGLIAVIVVMALFGPIFATLLNEILTEVRSSL